MRLKEKYPKNISFYLEEKIKLPFSLGFNFLDKELEVKYKAQKKNLQKNKYDDISKDFKFIYFHPDFFKKSNDLIKEDKKKEEFLSFISSIIGGNKKYYTQERLKIINNFIYSSFIAKEPKLKLKINFCIFFEKTPRKKPYNTYIQKIYFLDLSEDKDSPEKKISKKLNEFEQNFKYRNNDLEYDKMINLGEMKEKLFCEIKNSDEFNYINTKDNYYFFPYEIRTRNEIYKTIKIFDKEYLLGFNPSIWDLKFPINSVLQKIGDIENFNYNSFFERDVLEFHPSKMETKLININDNFILSGRPGTGKTVIILIKIIMNFLRCIYEHSNIIKGKIDFDYINDVILKKIFNSNLNYLNEKEEEKDENYINNITDNENKLIDNFIPKKLKSPDENNNNNEEEDNDEDDQEENSENTIKTTSDEGLGSEGCTYKIIFTSLSQSLCSFAENTFIRGLKRTPNITCEIYPTSQNTYEKMSSFIHQQKYPLFMNFRKLIFMIDGSLNFQFFDRPNKNNLRKRQDDCDIRFYPDCQYDVMVDLSFMIYRPYNIYFYRREYLEDPLIMTEINEDSFYNNFDKQIQNNKILNNDKSHISTYEVYSNIISIIKGSIKSYLVGALSLNDYLSTGKKICPFDKEQKEEIYKIFQLYENWKYKNKYFDFQDVVNYLIREVNIELVPQNKKMFDLVFIDEVQDFSINQLYLLFLISRDIKVLAGDTCQTLSKINTFRFADLNNALYTFASIKNIKINEPKNIEINLNFRCQANILKLAHFIYEMIKTFFSHTLDKVRMDFSTQVGGGEKPYLIPSEIKISESKKIFYKNLELKEIKTGFDYFLKGLTENNLFLDDPKSIINISFSVNHCVICRNNNVVKELNKKYNNKIFCSTAFESKGLEYEIVILYNFFKDSLPFVKEIWTYILKNINVKQVENNYLYLIKQNLDFEGFPSSIKDQIYSIFNQKFNIELSNNFNYQFSIYNFCSELKELYVAITRAKSRLYIYEEDKDILRLFMQKIFNYDIISQEIFNQKKDGDDTNKFKLILNQEDNYNLLNKKVNGCLKFINNNRLTKENLLKTAQDEYNQNNEYNYKKALYLFQVLNEETMKTKCEINLKFIEMQKLKGAENPQIKDQYISLNQEIFELIKKINYDDNKQIKGEILLNLERFDEALNYFINKNNYKKCGIVLIKQNKYEDALNYFIKGKEYSFAVSCLIEIKNYQRLYYFLLQNRDEFDLEHIQYFYKITCDKFFSKYIIPIKESKKGYKKQINKDIKKSENENNDNKKENKGIIFKVNYDLDCDCNTGNKKFLEEKNDLYNLITTEKIKIKNAFIFSSNTDKSIFDLEELEKTNNIFSLEKTREEIISLLNTFIELLNFMLTYLKIIITKTEKNKNQELFIETSEQLIKEIKNKLNQENITEQELNHLMEKIVIRKHEFKVIIIGILKNIEAKQYIYDLYEINIFKINILEHIQNDLPIVYKNVENIDYDKELLSKEMIKQVVSYCKFLPIKENDIIKYLNYIFIRSYNLNALIGITNKKDIKTLLDISVLLKKQKMFEFLVKLLDIDFTNGKIKNQSYKDVDISKRDILYYLNNYVNMLFHKFFKYYFNPNQDVNKINIILEKIKIFPQLYEILHLISTTNDRIINLSSLIGDIDEIICDDIVNFDSNNLDIDMNNYLKLISIGNKISILDYLLCFHKISINFNLKDNIEENSKIFNYLMNNIAKILDIYNYIKESNVKRHLEDKIILSFINVIIEDKNENFPIIINENLSLTNYNYFNNFSNYFKKLFYIKQNTKHFEDSLNKQNNIIFDSYKFISSIKNFKYYFIDHLFDYLEENKLKEKYIKSKYLYLLDEESLLDLFDNNSSLNQLIKYIYEFYYLGEYTINIGEMDNYLSTGKIILNCLFQKSTFEKVVNEALYGENKRKDNYNKLIEFILFTNIIGGSSVMINYYAVVYKFYHLFKDIKNAFDIFFHKEFSYFHAFKIILDHYNPNLNQLLIIIWLRKLYNLFFVILYEENKNNAGKIYLDKTRPDIKLNIFNIKTYLANLSGKKIISFNNNYFIDKYLSILSFFVKNIKMNNEKNKDILPEIKIFLSEIYYSLESAYSFVIEEKLKLKIKLTLDEIIKEKNLFLDDKSMFKEVLIINNENIYKKVEKIYIRDIDISLISGYEDEGEEEYEYNDNNDDYEDDYGDIEENLKKPRKRKDYW